MAENIFKILIITIIFIMLQYLLHGKRGCVKIIKNLVAQSSALHSKLRRRFLVSWKSSYFIFFASVILFNSSIWGIYINKAGLREVRNVLDDKHPKEFYEKCFLEQRMYLDMLEALLGENYGEEDLKGLGANMRSCPFGGGKYTLDGNNHINCNIHGSYKNEDK